MRKYVVLASVVRRIHVIMVLGGIVFLGGMLVAALAGSARWLTFFAGMSCGFGGATLAAQLACRGDCPLTRLENQLRARYDLGHKPMTSFASDWLKRTFSIKISTRTAEVLNLVLLLTLFLVPLAIFIFD